LVYASISRQVNALEVIVRSNPVFRPLLDRLDDLQLATADGAAVANQVMTWY
jgi:hypothetical protein